MPLNGKYIIILLAVLVVLGASALFSRNYFSSSRTKDEKAYFPNISIPDNLPPEAVVLKVEGRIGRSSPALIDLKTIQAFTPVTFTSYDPWDKKKQKYKGVPIIDLLEFLELDDKATEIEIVARNDYKIMISIKDLRRFKHIFSYAMNGKLYKEYEGSKNKGPLAVALDFDGNPEMDMEVYKHQLVWLVDKVTVK